MQIRDTDKLKEWLLKKLEPLCDADPAALAKYVVALLKKEKPRAILKDLCVDQLEVFLAKETGRFVEQLFSGLDNESYLKGVESSSVANNSTETQHIGTERMQSEDHSRRNEVDDEDRDFRRSKRGGDGGVGRRVVSTVSNSGLGKKRRMDGGQEGGQGPIRRRIEYSGSGVSSSSAPLKRPIRERLGVRHDDSRSGDGRGRRYHHTRSSSSSSSLSDSGSSSDSDRRGRGRKRKHYSKNRSSSTEEKRKQRCKDYDEKGVCILGESCPYDHGVDPLVIGGNEIPPFSGPPLVLPPQGMPLPPTPQSSEMMIPPVLSGPSRGTVKLTDGYNPEDPALSTSKADFLPMPLMLPMGPRFTSLPPPIPGMSMPPPLSLTSIPPHPIAPPTFPHPRPFLGKHKPSDTVIIKKIPRDLNTITRISGHFEKFGTIVNVKVRHEGDPEAALVQFSSPREATKAHNSAEAVLGNRFIKVFYLKMIDQPRVEVSIDTPISVAVSACGPPGNESSNVSSSEQTTSRAPPPVSSSVAPKPALHGQPNTAQPQHTTPPLVSPQGNNRQQKRSVDAAKKRQQKRTTEAVKKSLELQKKTHELLQKQIEQQKLLIAKLEKSGKQLPPEEKSKIIATLKSLSNNITKLKEAATTIKKRTDSTTEDTVRTQPQSAAEGLRKKADALRREAHELGLLKSPSQPLAVGRGPPPQKRPRQEGKPRKLLIIGAQERDKLTSYFESFGNLEQVEIDPDDNNNLIFTFQNAFSANKAVKSGSTFNDKPLIMKWYSPKPPPISPTLPTLGPQEVSLPTRNEQVRPIAASALVKPDPAALHLTEDSDDDKEDSRSWKR